MHAVQSALHNYPRLSRLFVKPNMMCPVCRLPKTFSVPGCCANSRFWRLYVDVGCRHIWHEVVVTSSSVDDGRGVEPLVGG